MNDSLAIDRSALSSFTNFPLHQASYSAPPVSAFPSPSNDVPYLSLPPINTFFPLRASLKSSPLDAPLPHQFLSSATSLHGSHSSSHGNITSVSNPSSFRGYSWSEESSGSHGATPYSYPLAPILSSPSYQSHVPTPGYSSPAHLQPSPKFAGPSSSPVMRIQSDPASRDLADEYQIVIKENLLILKQSEAAKKLGMTTSTFSKRWRDSLKARKWPHRTHKKLSNLIVQLSTDVEPRSQRSEEKRTHLLELSKKNLEPAIITLKHGDVDESRRVVSAFDLCL